MNAETWLTAERAVAEGLADEILDPSKDEPKSRLVDQITGVTASVNAVIDDVEGLVASRADAGSPLTGAKREGLVALRAAAARADGLLNDGTTVEEPPEIVEARMALARRANDFQASIPLQFLG